MPLFNIGDSVIYKDNNQKGRVINVIPARGRVYYDVIFPSGEARMLEPDLSADCDVSNPFERCMNGMFSSYSEFSKRNTTFKIKNSNNSTISSLKASRTLFRAYQFKPLLKFLNSPMRRLLIADEVGLGKTIEAGHIMMELKARNELKNVLIVCPKSLQYKWQAELYEKFGLDFKIIEHTEDLIADLKSKSGRIFAIINYERIRKRKEKPEDESAVQKKKSYNLIDYLSSNPHSFSLILCDEAHKMRNRETQTYKGAEVLMSCASSAVFLTATPVMISEENLYNLLHLVDNSRFFNYDIFRNRMNENRPFLESISMLNSNAPFNKILETLAGAEVTSSFTSDEREIFNNTRSINEIYGEDPLFREIVSLLSGEDNNKTRARLQYLLAKMSPMNPVFSRTRKREVTTDMSQAERMPHLCRIDLTDNERECFDEIINNYIDDNSYTDWWGEEKLTQGGVLGLVQKKRQVASSVWGYNSDEKNLDKGIDEYADQIDSKVEKLIEVLKEVFKGGVKKLVVFALFRKTLKYLHIRLKKAGYNSLIIHGDIKNRAEILQNFKDDSNIHILLSSEVGSEGLDMQFCNSMVNYDLPWNPMVVEQRIGRIDRFGQKSPVVNIYNFVVADSIQEDIYNKLLDRIGIFKGTIGDMEAILDAEIAIGGTHMTIQDAYNRLEKEFFTTSLSDKVRERKIQEIALACENERENLKHLQEGLNNTLTNDAYFKEEIHRILNKKAYVTEEELLNYLQSLIREELTTCNLKKVDDNVWKFKMPLSNTATLRNFLIRYSDSANEAQIGLHLFLQRIQDENEFLLTFNQDAAYNNQTINYMNIYHPLIQGCLNFFLQKDNNTLSTFSYAVPADELLDSGSRYYMALYKIAVERTVQGIKKTSEELMPLVFDIRNKEIVSNQHLIDRLFSKSQNDGEEKNALNQDTDKDMISDMSADFTDFISNYIKNRKEEETRQLESDRRRNIQQTIEYYDARMEIFNHKLREYENELEWFPDDEKRKIKNKINLTKGQIKRLENERDDRLAKISDSSELNLCSSLLSLNLITIN